jgi:hypothetical protein
MSTAAAAAEAAAAVRCAGIPPLLGPTALPHSMFEAARRRKRPAKANSTRS